MTRLKDEPNLKFILLWMVWKKIDWFEKKVLKSILENEKMTHLEKYKDKLSAIDSIWNILKISKNV